MKIYIATTAESGDQNTIEGVFCTWAKAYEHAQTINCYMAIEVYELDNPTAGGKFSPMVGRHWVRIRDRSLRYKAGYWDSPLIANPIYSETTEPEDGLYAGVNHDL
jgi:hypothetical protein